MNQYVNWTGAGNHDAFYTSAQCKKGSKDSVNYIVDWTNSLTGVKYKACPANFAWELANEPRCQSDTSGRTLVNWADEMSTYFKSIDPYLLVSVGDEGFLRRSGATDWFYNGGEGVDWDSLIVLKNTDFGTVQLYPDHWGTSVEWGVQWIKDYTSQDKPVILEEDGIRGAKNTVDQAWCAALENSGYAGSMFWLLTGIQEDGQLYADYDGFRVVYPSTTATLLAEDSQRMASSDGPEPTVALVPTPTKRPEVTPSNSPVITPTPTAATGCVVTYTQNDWGAGATVNVAIKNNGSTPINNWILEFSFSGKQKSRINTKPTSFILNGSHCEVN